MRPKSRNDFAIAIICALPLEADAVEALFDEHYDRLGKYYSKQRGDANSYVNGRIGKHDVVLCYMPGMGKGSAAGVAAKLQISYTGIKLALVVGICGGAPSPPEYREIFLADVIISDSVIEYDFGRQYPGGFLRKTGVKETMGRPSPEIRSLLNGIRAEKARSELQSRTQQYLQVLQQRGAKWCHPGVSDVLFRASYLHKHHSHVSPARCSCYESDSREQICEEALDKDCHELGCNNGQQIRCREVSEAIQTSIYIGQVASADTVMKSGQHRDEIARREKVIGFEMEGAGVWDYVPCIIIKGVCDYADSHKNKLRQTYAAATGASVAKAFLEYWILDACETHGPTGSMPPFQGIHTPTSSPVAGQHIGNITYTTYFFGGNQRNHTSRFCPADTKTSTWMPASREATTFSEISPSRGTKAEIVGRAEQLSKLEELLLSSGRQRKAAITGLGGVGKTQVALEFAYQTQEKRPECSIYWISSMNFETLQQTYSQIVRNLRLPGLEEEQADAKQLLKDYLCDRSSGEWLLIFDNADDISMWFGNSQGNTKTPRLSDYIPWSITGSVLFTTRFKKTATKLAMQNVIPLPDMDEPEATELFEERLRDKTLLQNRNEIALLLKRLVYLPLAIVQAASYINENCLSALSEYLSLLSDQEEEAIQLLSEDFQDDWRYQDHTNPIAATWLISFEQIQRTNTFAAKVLFFMACIGPTDIPESLLPPAPSRKEWFEAIGTLKGYSFVSTRSSEQFFNLHRLVHLATRNRLRKEGSLLDWTSTALMRLEDIFPSYDYTNRNTWKAYLPHALVLLGKDEAQHNDRGYQLLFKVSQCLLADGRPREAVKYLEQYDKWREKYFGKEHPSRLASQHELAVAYLANGQIKQVVELLEHVVTVRKRTLAEEHPDRLASQHELAVAYQANGQIKQAVELLEHVVTVEGRTLAEEHPDRLASQHELARAYQANGQIKQVVELLEHVVTLRKRTLAENHPDRLASESALINWLRHMPLT
ncbi:hypothetical protein BDV11DRAFT_173357 [Aspergillus similis]